jgi:hypothetical protein
MNNIDLESLPYPMFETTEGEKDCLREALPYITEEDREYFLCLIVTHTINNACGRALREKIKQVIGEHYALPDCLGLGDNEDDVMHAELRRIWIRKLLEYTGE